MTSRNGRSKPNQAFLLPPGEAQSSRTRVEVAIQAGRLADTVRAYLSASRAIELVEASVNGSDPGADVAVIVLPAPATTGDYRPATNAGKLVALVAAETDELLLMGAATGVWSLIALDAPPQTLISTVRSVHLGQCLLLAQVARRPAVASSLLQLLRNGSAGARARLSQPSPLTEREATILAGVAQGSNSGKIASGLGLSEQTVKNYVAEILQKMGARTRGQAAALAVQHGWLGRLP